MLEGRGLLPPGHVVGGRYAIVTLLGRGGYGVVYAADDMQLSRRVALKLVSPHKAMSSDAEARFLREVKICAQLTSEHVARVFDAGSDPIVGSFFVMELLEGADLAQHTKNAGPCSIERGASFIMQACEPLAEAHLLGVVHRDLKPSNLFLAHQAGTSLIKVLDFGMAKLVENAEALTRTGVLVGTPRYMAPEQLAGAPDIDPRTDVWGLGVTLYELLTGAPIFDIQGGSAAFGALVLSAQPIPLRARLPGAPPELEQIIATCLEKDRNRRFQSTVDVAHALSPFSPSSASLVTRMQSLRTEGRPTAWSPPSPSAPSLGTASTHVASARAPTERAEPPTAAYGPAGTREIHPHYAGAASPMAVASPHALQPIALTAASVHRAPSSSRAGAVLGVVFAALVLSGGAYGAYAYMHRASKSDTTQGTDAAAASIGKDDAGAPLALSSGAVTPSALASAARSATAGALTVLPTAPAIPAPPKPPTPARDAGIPSPPASASASSQCDSAQGIPRGLCGGDCVALNKDSSCGSCNNKCSGDKHCLMSNGTGSCQACPSGRTYCGGVCLDLQQTTAHCGACFHMCKASPGRGASCVRGQCVEVGH